MVEKIKVVKRNGKKVDFDGSKIALAIKKGFDSVDTFYEADDVNKVYNKVIIQIRKLGKDSIKIEQIQDLIEQELQKNGYEDVYASFAEYRERRAKSRATFSDEKRLHKFLKVIEKLALKGNSNSNNAEQTMLKFGSTLSKEFSKTYLIKKVYSDAHDNGDIYVHNIEYMPMGTTESCVVNLQRVFKNREIDLCEVEELLSKLQNEQHGIQMIPALDTCLAPIVLKTFREQFKQTIEELLEFSDFDKFIATSAIEREIDKLTSVQFDIAIFDKYTREADSLKRLFKVAYKNAMHKTEEIISKEITNFICRLNKKCVINYGLDTSVEGKMISKNIKFETNADFSKKPEYILSTTTINLPRLALKNMGKKQEDFEQELDEKLELIKDQLLERFDQQCSKTAGQFPTLIMQGVWQDGEKLEAQDKLRRVLKQGSLRIGYIGLAECVKALTR